ncbi:MAG: hypothetical protein O2897_05115 [bacterium]|nr:hypothetical protein [bacterium]
MQRVIYYKDLQNSILLNEATDAVADLVLSKKMSLDEAESYFKIINNIYSEINLAHYGSFNQAFIRLPPKALNQLNSIPQKQLVALATMAGNFIGNESAKYLFGEAVGKLGSLLGLGSVDTTGPALAAINNQLNGIQQTLTQMQSELSSISVGIGSLSQQIAAGDKLIEADISSTNCNNLKSGLTNLIGQIQQSFTDLLTIAQLRQSLTGNSVTDASVQDNINVKLQDWSQLVSAINLNLSNFTANLNPNAVQFGLYKTCQYALFMSDAPLIGPSLYTNSKILFTYYSLFQVLGQFVSSQHDEYQISLQKAANLTAADVTAVLDQNNSLFAQALPCLLEELAEQWKLLKPQIPQGAAFIDSRKNNGLNTNLVWVPLLNPPTQGAIAWTYEQIAPSISTGGNTLAATGAIATAISDLGFTEQTSSSTGTCVDVNSVEYQ